MRLCKQGYKLEIEYLNSKPGDINNNYAVFCYHLQNCKACKDYARRLAGEAERAVMPDGEVEG